MNGKALLLGLCTLLTSLSTLQGRERAVRFFMDIARFQDARLSDPTAEIYFSVDGTSVVHKLGADGKYHASVKISWFLQRLTDGDSVGLAGDRLLLDWPEGQYPADTSNAVVRRQLFHFHYLKLPPGRYLLQAIVSDENAPNDEATVAFQEFEMEPKESTKIQFSDIKWIAYRRASGARFNRQDLHPLVTNDAYINQDSLVFYQEIYNIANHHQGRFFIRARVLQGDNVLYAFEKIQVRTTNEVGVNAYMMSLLGLEKLRSNTYHLQVELLNNRNEPFASYKRKFYVYNSRLDTDFEALSNFNREADLFNEYDEERLDYYLRTLFWISTEQEKQFIRVLESRDQKKNYLLSFWEKRKKFPNQKVATLWRGHLMALDYVNQNFNSNLNEGWRTDRGRIFLKYGIPSDVERYMSESAAVPWELWRYDRLGAQSNVIFVFYDPDLTTGEYPLLHSSKYGEVYNPRWQEQITDRNSSHTPSAIDFDRTNSQIINDKLDPNN